MWKASFQALSYEWGHDGDLGGHIFINGLLEPNPIRRNLELVLRTVRDRTKEKVLWIDSICINQHDPIERGQQVAMMGDIFSAATGVIAWLGPEAKGSGTAMDLIENTRKLETRMCLDRDLSESEMQALIILLHRTYWRRVWVIQELLMAKTCEIRCGSKIITRMQFNNFLGCINRPGTQFEDRKWAKARAGNPAEAHRLAHEFNIPGTTFKRLNTLRIWLRRCYKSGFEATDPRDLIYALIGAADDVPRGHLVPNYEGTIREALVQAVPYVRDDVSPWSPSAAQSLAFFMVQYAERMGLSAEDDLLQEILDIMNERPVLSQ
ncbi:heterokaryon incompatibility protein-domain-containing protein [Podospora aff. communis PSN243]|uniref:Heterokaryon incompatibility protein-domain-containing protein n=1 Tax=Podospora aff. communis PSN243 TaxID=3040156 RepID=A0AAV9GMV5_9PEZI|nr:heterokaryon incompatibility protein-domain-containing protein [Podospora aff. communis PSN243]